MGGGTGTGAAPVVARASKEQGILTVAVVTKPFFFEGNQRMRLADEGLSELKKEVDAIIVIPNDRLLSISGKDTSFKDAFAMCDDVLRQAVEGISDLITTPGIINVDFADIKAIMADTGTALMGIGQSAGEDRAVKAATEAINSPLLEVSIDGAQGVLFAIAGNDDLTIHEVQEAAKVITQSVDKDAKIIFGTIKDDRLNKGEVKVTVIATGFPQDGQSRKQAQQVAPQPTRVVIEEKKEPTVQSVQAPIKEETPTTSEYVRKSGTDTKPERIIIDDDFGDDTDDWSAVPAFLRRKK